MPVVRAITAAVAVLFFSASASAQLADKKVITLELAKQVAAVAEREIAKNNFTMFVAIVDDNGVPVFVERVGDAQPGSYEVAVAKGRTAAIYRRPTKAFEDRVTAGTTALLSIPQITAVEGGEPLVVDGKVVGAIGVSGGTQVQDGIIARAAAEALAGLLKK